MLRRAAKLLTSNLSLAQAQVLEGALGRQGICSTSYAASTAHLDVPIYKFRYDVKYEHEVDAENLNRKPSKKITSYNVDYEEVGRKYLPEDIFGLEVRKDILHKVVRWHRAKKQQGTHVTKGKADVRGGGRKPRPQKGSGRSRQGSIRSPQWRGGGVVHGPVLRSHAHKLPKKVRRLGLKCALSARALEERVRLVHDFRLPEAKTKFIKAGLEKFMHGEERKSLLLVDDKESNPSEGEMIRKAVGNLHWIDILPCTALNVYTILKCTHLVMTQQALDTLTTRLRTPIFRGPIDRAKWNGTLVVQPIPLAA